jgi:hypothetical protein
MNGQEAVLSTSCTLVSRVFPKNAIFQMQIFNLRLETEVIFKGNSAKKRRFIPFFKAVNYQPSENRLLETTT